MDSSKKRTHTGEHPRLSVVVGAYNGERFLRPAIESILNQTFDDFELIVIDDCSTDTTRDVLQQFNDERIRIVRNERNLGIAKTLNKGISLAKGEYIALQDHDDISMPTRFACQVKFLDEHHRVGMLGSSCKFIDESGFHIMHWPVECSDSELKWALLWRNPFFHTTLMLRREVFQAVGGYSTDPQYRFAEDYELMSRVARRFVSANIRAELGCWRTHHSSASKLNLGQQADAVKAISKRNIRDLLGWDIDPVYWQGVEKFLYHPVREPLELTTEEVHRTLDFLVTIHAKFCGRYGLAGYEALMHRKSILWPWGRHALTLSYRRNGRRDTSCRFALLSGGARLTVKAFWPA